MMAIPPHNDSLTVGLAQIAPVWLQRDATLAKVRDKIAEAAQQGCHLVAFGEALVPGYPWWLEYTDAARFNATVQKELFAHYLAQGVQIESGHLRDVCACAADNHIAVVLGCMERPLDRGGHSLYCSLVYIAPSGEIAAVHRKLMPTYEERLVWSPGDGHGLRVHPLGAFHVGALNCWENWMPLPRAALYGLGEDLHVALWPGNEGNTRDITRFIAQESRSYVLSVAGLLRREQILPTTPHYDLLVANCPEVLANGGSCLAGPDGEWVIAPVVEQEGLFVATLDHQRVRAERQNFDPAGHYARPDVTELHINRQRQSTIRIADEFS